MHSVLYIILFLGAYNQVGEIRQVRMCEFYCHISNKIMSH